MKLERIMESEYGSDFISITDEDGNEYELEVLDQLEHEGVTYMALVNADEENEDEGEDEDLIILKVVEENGEEILSTPDNEEEADLIYGLFMDRLFAEDSEDEDE